MSKRIYTGFSFFEFIWTLFLRIAAVFGLIYSLFYFDENPIIISLVVFLCLLAILFIGDDQIVLYPDRLVHMTNSFASLIFRQKGKTYEIQNIKCAYLQPKGSGSELAVGMLLAFMLSKRNSSRSRPIFLDLKNGETVRIETYLERNQMKKIVNIINQFAD